MTIERNYFITTHHQAGFFHNNASLGLGWPVSSFALSVKSWLHNCEQEFDPPRRLFPWARNLALSSWANADTARGGPQIASALSAINWCITLLYRVRIPAAHYA